MAPRLRQARPGSPPAPAVSHDTTVAVQLLVGALALFLAGCLVILWAVGPGQDPPA